MIRHLLSTCCVPGTIKVLYTHEPSYVSHQLLSCVLLMFQVNKGTEAQRDSGVGGFTA